MDRFKIFLSKKANITSSARVGANLTAKDNGEDNRITADYADQHL
jgi:hypothetical protein